MHHNIGVMQLLPVNAIGIQILNVIVTVLELVKASRTILNHTEEKHITGAPGTLSIEPNLVFVPGLCPVSGILIDAREKEMVKEPYMGVEIGAKTTAELEGVEKIAPLASKSSGDIAPKTLNTYIVDASTPCMSNDILKTLPQPKHAQSSSSGRT
jgi:hypothetical protein